MSYYRLQSEEIAKLIAREKLKRWWVAEQAGIHKTTLRRWLSGHIDKVRSNHVEDLARVLTVPIGDIAHPLVD
jgi:hypothetical protein